MTINRALLLLLLSCSSIAWASQGQSSMSEPATIEAGHNKQRGPCAVTLRGQVKDPISCTLSLAAQRR